MGYCDMCQSAGSVNRYGFCEVCGNEHEAEDQANFILAEAAAIGEAARLSGGGGNRLTYREEALV